MMARDKRRSTVTALAFMATSMPPIEPPKMNMAMAASGTFGASATTSRPKLPMRPNQRSTVRDPCLEIRWPHQVIAVTAPAPNSRISRPSVNLLISSRVSTTGICGAHAPVRKPLARKMAATAHRPRMAACMRFSVSIV
jgi:hypothetical protein